MFFPQFLIVMIKGIIKKIVKLKVYRKVCWFLSRLSLLILRSLALNMNKVKLMRYTFENLFRGRFIVRETNNLFEFYDQTSFHDKIHMVGPNIILVDGLL